MKPQLSFVLLCSLCWPLVANAQEEATNFVTPTIDLGCVVNDLDASVRFYTQAIGFRRAGSFEVPADFATKVGLTDEKTLNIVVLTLGNGPGATKLKLMQTGNSEKPANDHIHSSLGFSYITVAVKDIDVALKRLKKAGVEPIAKGPMPLPKNLNPDVTLTVVRDPDGNFVELVGPKSKK